jgi:hypothetical protein
MRRLGFVVIVAGLAFGAACCDDPLEPQMCVRSADAPGADDPNCPASSATTTLRAGQAFYVVHRLPDDVDSEDLELTVRVETPCATIEQKPTYIGPAAVALFIAPEGADCSTIVTGIVANSRIQLASRADPASCARASAVCGQARTDAGTEPAVDASTD